MNVSSEVSRSIISSFIIRRCLLCSVMAALYLAGPARSAQEARPQQSGLQRQPIRREDVIRFSDFPPDHVWRAYNSTVRAVRDTKGDVVWRWQISGGQEASLWVNEALPFHARLNQYQRFVFDINFIEGRIELVWPRTVGLMPAPADKLAAEWNLFYFTHPHKVWLTYQQEFDNPSWNSSAMSGIPATVAMDRARLLSFVALPKGESCTIELRRCRLVRNRIRIQKPYLTEPLGWPLRVDQVVNKPGENSAKSVVYRTPYFVQNVSTRAALVKGIVASRHTAFRVSTSPGQATVAPGQTARFDVVATLDTRQRRNIAPLAEETAVVDFVADGDWATAYRTETFCTAPLPASSRRLVVLTPREVAELKAKGQGAVDAAARLWMSVDLAGQRDIPGYIDHHSIMLPYHCPRCQKGLMEITSRWLEIKCNNAECDYSERHTQWADALWIATWSTIHNAGPSPVALGRAYLSTGDERYARKAIELLTLLALGYKTLPWHHAGHPAGQEHEEPAGPQAWANGASTRWGTTPTYGTDFMIQGLAELDNMIVDSPSWTLQQRRAVNNGLWLPVVTELIKIVPGLSNMNDIINRDLVLIGHNTDDANILYRGVAFPTGILPRLQDISADGFSDEGAALNYHLAAMREWLPSLKLLANSSLPWASVHARVLAALRMPILRAALNGTAYCTGNSGIAWHHVDLDGDMFKLAEEIFRLRNGRTDAPSAPCQCSSAMRVGLFCVAAIQPRRR